MLQWERRGSDWQWLQPGGEEKQEGRSKGGIKRGENTEAEEEKAGVGAIEKENPSGTEVASGAVNSTLPILRPQAFPRTPVTKAEGGGRTFRARPGA